MATYVQSVLGNGENVAHQAKISIWLMTPQILLGLVILPIATALPPIMLLSLLLWLAAFIKYKTTELAVTNKRVIAKFGWIQRSTIEMALPKIESIQINQSVLGRICNYGSIIISGAGNPQAPVPGISNPMEFRRKFMDAQEQSTKA